jgi:hypothetical protein
MGASLVAWVLLAALPPPPADDGPACQEWAVEAAERLLVTPQPPASGLGGVTSGGLSEIPPDLWSSFPSLTFGADDAERARRRPVKEGTAPVSSDPALDGALRTFEEPLRRVLRAAFGPRNVLSDGWQIWCTMDCPQQVPSVDRARFAVPTLALALGWRGLEQRRRDDALLGCVGLAGFLRASAGTGLVGQMVAGSFVHALSLECLAASKAASASEVLFLASSIEVVVREWPALSHTLTQELVFGQVLGADRLPADLRARLSPRWLPLVRSSSVSPLEDRSMWADVRRTLFGRLAMREHCLALAKSIRVVDGAPGEADPVLIAAGAPTFFGSLAWEGGGVSRWIGYVRRARRQQTELRMLLTALEASVGKAALPMVDTRTGRPLELRGTASDRVVVAFADPAFEAEELRLPVPEGRPTSP